MVLVQNGPFFQLFILDNICQENVLYDILERKKAFQDYKKKISKSRKIDIFPKGLTHAFWSNDGHFSNIFFLGNLGRKNGFYDILQRQKPLSRL